MIILVYRNRCRSFSMNQITCVNVCTCIPVTLDSRLLYTFCVVFCCAFCFWFVIAFCVFRNPTRGRCWTWRAEVVRRATRPTKTSTRWWRRTALEAWCSFQPPQTFCPLSPWVSRSPCCTFAFLINLHVHVHVVMYRICSSVLTIIPDPTLFPRAWRPFLAACSESF